MVDPIHAVRGSPSLRRARCSECKTSFRPHARLKLRQKTCGKRECQLAYRARYRHQYRIENPGPEKEYRDKTKAGCGASFWKNYRKTHPVSSERNRAATRLRSKLGAQGLQRQLDIVQVIDPPGYLDLFLGFATSHRSLIHACQATRAA